MIRREPNHIPINYIKKRENGNRKIINKVDEVGEMYYAKV